MTDPGVHHSAELYLEVGAATIVLALLARLASRLGFSAIPLFLLLGLAFGNGGLLPLNVSQRFMGGGAQIGVLVFFGLEIDPATLPPALPLAIGLGIVTALTKVLAGYWAANRAGFDRRASFRAGMELMPRGEFSIVIAGLGAAIEPRLGPLAAAYVLFLAILGPIAARLAK